MATQGSFDRPDFTPRSLDYVEFINWETSANSPLDETSGAGHTKNPPMAARVRLTLEKLNPGRADSCAVFLN